MNLNDFADAFRYRHQGGARSAWYTPKDYGWPIATDAENYFTPKPEKINPFLVDMEEVDGVWREIKPPEPDWRQHPFSEWTDRK